jgi:hypothetical protein
MIRGPAGDNGSRWRASPACSGDAAGGYPGKDRRPRIAGSDRQDRDVRHQPPVRFRRVLIAYA